MARVSHKFKDISPELERLVSPNPNKGRSSIGNDRVREIYELSLNSLIPFKNQARKNFNIKELENLKQSILEVGVRQPLSVIKSDDGLYEIISGERRYQAAKLAGLERVPCLILKDSEEPNTIALIENIHRKDLHPIELGAALCQAIEGKGYGSKKELAEKVGMDFSKVSLLISTQSLPESVKKILLERNIKSRSTLRKLLKLDNESCQLASLSPSEITKHKKIGEIFMDKSGNFKMNIGIENLSSQQKECLKKEFIKLTDELC